MRRARAGVGSRLSQKGGVSCWQQKGTFPPSTFRLGVSPTDEARPHLPQPVLLPPQQGRAAMEPRPCT